MKPKIKLPTFANSKYPTFRMSRLRLFLECLEREDFQAAHLHFHFYMRKSDTELDDMEFETFVWGLTQADVDDFFAHIRSSREPAG